jgi:malate dehydrogenase (oxaloacetate-decarboxylating)
MRIRKRSYTLDMLGNLPERALKAHARLRGKIEIVGRARIKGLEDLAIFYTPGVAYVSNAIRADKSLSYKYTGKGNRIAIITDGSRILGLGDIGPEAGMPVMEGKAMLFKKFGDVNAIPLALSCRTTDEIVAVAKAIEPVVGGINIEDIAPPRCFEVFERLQKELNIPVFHDDRQGTAVVVLAALKNAMKVVGKDLETARIVINGIGSAGVGIAQLLTIAGVTNIIMCDTEGILYKGRKRNMSEIKIDMAEHTNKNMKKGQLADAVRGADVLIGASTMGAFSTKLVRTMAKRAVVFALANPDPELTKDGALKGGVEVFATGQSDSENQVNNLVAFPAIFRGALDANARRINTAMLLAASDVLAQSVDRKKLSKDYVIPNFVQSDLVEITAEVAAAVAMAAVQTGVNGVNVDPNTIKRNVKSALRRYTKIENKIAKLDSGKVFGRLFK